jgi:predicted nicotinamide N-methyase
MKRYSSKQIENTLRKYTIKTTELTVAENVNIKLSEVENAYGLLDRMIEQEGRLHRVERYPYWAESWPAAVALSRWFCNAELQSRRIKELGCGIGLVGITLAHLGWHVEATDFVEDALVFTTYNARENRVSNRLAVSYLDWSNPVGRSCDCMVASDVVYEKKNHPYLAQVLRTLLLPGGVFYLSDPQRPLAKSFMDRLSRQGYGHREESMTVAWKSHKCKVDIHILNKPL